MLQVEIRPFLSTGLLPPTLAYSPETLSTFGLIEPCRLGLVETRARSSSTAIARKIGSSFTGSDAPVSVLDVMFVKIRFRAAFTCE